MKLHAACITGCNILAAQDKHFGNGKLLLNTQKCSFLAVAGVFMLCDASSLSNVDVLQMFLIASAVIPFEGHSPGKNAVNVKKKFHRDS